MLLAIFAIWLPKRRAVDAALYVSASMMTLAPDGAIFLYFCLMLCRRPLIIIFLAAAVAGGWRQISAACFLLLAR